MFIRRSFSTLVWLTSMPALAGEAPRSQVLPVLPTAEVTGSTEGEGKLRASAAVRFGAGKWMSMVISPFIEAALNGGSSLVTAVGPLPEGTERADEVRFGGHVDFLFVEQRTTASRLEQELNAYVQKLQAEMSPDERKALGRAAWIDCKERDAEECMHKMPPQTLISYTKYLPRRAVATCLRLCDDPQPEEEVKKFCDAYEPAKKLRNSTTDAALAVSNAQVRGVGVDDAEQARILAELRARHQELMKEADGGLELVREKFLKEEADYIPRDKYCPTGEAAYAKLERMAKFAGEDQFPAYLSLGTAGERTHYEYLEGDASLTKAEAIRRPFMVGISAGGLFPSRWAVRRGHPLSFVIDGFLGFRSTYAASTKKIEWCRDVGTLDGMPVKQCEKGILNGPTGTGRVGTGLFFGVATPMNAFARFQAGVTFASATGCNGHCGLDVGLHLPATLSFLESIVGKDADYKGLVRVIPSLRWSRRYGVGEGVDDGEPANHWLKGPTFLMIVELRTKRSFYMQALDWL